MSICGRPFRDDLGVTSCCLDAGHVVNCKRSSEPTLRPLDVMIGRLDRILSEFLLAAASDLDEADRQTIKHHADDLIGVGGAALEKIKERR